MFLCRRERDVQLPDSAAEGRRVLLRSASELQVRKLPLPELVRLREGALNDTHPS
jgi:hypothetical protein